MKNYNGYNWFIAERLNKDYYIFYYKIIIKYQKSIYYAFLGNSYFNCFNIDKSFDSLRFKIGQENSKTRNTYVNPLKLDCNQSDMTLRNIGWNHNILCSELFSETSWPKLTLTAKQIREFLLQQFRIPSLNVPSLHERYTLKKFTLNLIYSTWETY